MPLFNSIQLPTDNNTEVDFSNSPYSSQSLYQPSTSFEAIPDLTAPQANPRTGPTNPGFQLFGQGGANLAAGFQGIGSLANAFAAYKQFKLGKDTLAQNKAAFNLNSANQAKVTNAAIEDRALRRAAQRSDLAGDFNAIQAAADKVSSARRVSGAPI